jgi:RimJ/RimL family protein N-acetyltransferase
MSTVLQTARMELVGCTPDALRAEGEDRARFGALLNARIPAEWPPELYDDDARLWTLAFVESHPEHAAWSMYYLVLRDGEQGREAVGIVGYKGPPAEDGTVEIGYGVLPAHRRRGLAAEASEALVRRAFEHPGVRRVTAETYPHLVASIGVLEKLGFTLEGPGSEEGVVRYGLPRERWAGR